MDTELLALLNGMICKGGSELLLTTWSQPMVRVDGTYQPFPGTPVLTMGDAQRLIEPYMNRERWRCLGRDGCASFQVRGRSGARFQVELFQSQRGWVAVFQIVRREILGARELGIPDQLMKITGAPHGLVALCGPPSSGKSTVEAAMVDWVNNDRSAHILVLEERPGIRHSHKKAVIHHCAVLWHDVSLDELVPSLIRRGLDVVVVRDAETAKALSCALELARRGLLVMTTFCASSAVEGIRRLSAVGGSTFATDLLAVTSQRLIPKATGYGHCLAMEIVMASPEVRGLIRKGRAGDVRRLCRSGRHLGSQSMEESIGLLYSRSLITLAAGDQHCDDPFELRRVLRKLPRRAGLPRSPLLHWRMWRRRAWIRRRQRARWRRRRWPFLATSTPRLHLNMLRGVALDHSEPKQVNQVRRAAIWVRATEPMPAQLKAWHRRSLNA